MSPHADDVVPKGAQPLLVHTTEPHRPAQDLDLLRFGSDDASDVSRVFREASSLPVAPDGSVFDARTFTAEATRESARYGGARVKLLAKLERARGTLLEAETSAFTDVFWADPSKRAQGSAFLRRNDLRAAAVPLWARGERAWTSR